MTHSLNVQWEDPTALLDAAQKLPGLELVEAMRDGKVPHPPVAVVTGFRAVDAGEGRAAFEITPSEAHCSPNGTMQGGVVATVFDAALACAIQTHVGAGVACPTVDLAVKYLRPITPQTPPLRAEAEADHVGRRVATARARLVDADGKVYATATTTCLVVRNG